MPLNLADRLAIRTVIVPRCTAAVIHYCNHLLGLDPEAPGTDDYPAKLAWAKGAIQQPGGVGERVSHHFLNLQEYMESGSGISDSLIQGTVEHAINNHFLGA